MRQLLFATDLHCLGFASQKKLLPLLHSHRIAKLGCQYSIACKLSPKPVPTFTQARLPSVPAAFVTAFQSSERLMPSHASGHRKASYQRGTSSLPFHFSLTQTSKASTNAQFSVEPESARIYCSSFMLSLNYTVFIFA